MVLATSTPHLQTPLLGVLAVEGQGCENDPSSSPTQDSESLRGGDEEECEKHLFY